MHTFHYKCNGVALSTLHAVPITSISMDCTTIAVKSCTTFYDAIYEAAAAQSWSWLDEIRVVLYIEPLSVNPTQQMQKKKSLLTVPELVETHYIVVGRWCLCRGCGSPKITPDITNKPFCLWCKLLNAICEWGTVAHINILCFYTWLQISLHLISL